MDHNKRILMLAVCIPLIIGLLGCASGGTTAVDREQAENAVAWPGGIYVPKYPLGVETLDAARKDLAGLLQRDTIDAYAGVRYFGRLDLDNSAYRKDPAAYARMVQAYMLIRDARGEFQYFLPRGGFVVLHDQIKVNPIFTLLYEDLIDRPITAEKRWNEEIRTSWPDINGNIVDDTIAGKYGIQYRPMYQRPYRVRCSGLIAFFFKKPTEAQRFADDLFFIQQTLKKHDETQRALFESQAAQYRALSTKPPISEAQRKYIVQANALNRLKDYAGAIGLYQKAITIDPVSYPGAYFNLALLNAQLQRYRTAITYMKQYLQLVPDAADARSAQDKIYEWELMIPAERNDSKAGPQARGYLGPAGP